MSESRSATVQYLRFFLKKTAGTADKSIFEIEKSDQPIDKEITHQNIHSSTTFGGGAESRQKFNYTFFDPITQIGGAEFWGDRDEQEDRVLFGTLDPRIAELSSDELQEVVKNTIDKIQKDIQDKIFHGKPERIGSCVCITLLIKNKLYVINLGDSTAFLVVVNPDSTPIITPLNALHRPTEPKEAERIKAANGSVMRGRMKGLLAVSRGMGDTFFDDAGFSHDPEITVEELNLPAGSIAFVINACDGLTESKETTQAKIASMTAKLNGAPLSEIAAALGLEALNDGSKDNISIIITLWDPNNLLPRISIVCDGHNGDIISEYLYQHLINELNAQIDAMIKKKSQGAPQPSSLKQ